MRGLPGQPTERAARVGGNTQPHRRRGVRDVVAELEQGPISRSWQPDAMTSRWRPWLDPGLRVFRLVQHEWEETGMRVRTSGPGVNRSPSTQAHRVQVVQHPGRSPRPVSHHVQRRAACPRRLYYTCYYTAAAISMNQPPATPVRLGG